MQSDDGIKNESITKLNECIKGFITYMLYIDKYSHY